MYAGGRGALQDYVQALKWYDHAAVRGDKLETKIRDIIARRMTPSQIDEAQRLAREWLAKRGKK